MDLKLSNNLVSIIIPTYNRVHLIGETLESIIAQSYKNWECIVVDDGSTDNTTTLIADYIKKDNRFQYYQRPFNRIKGANSCRNYGFELSKGKYVKWFDSDDIMHPDFLEKQVEVLEKNKDLDFCASFSKKFANTIDNLNEDYYPKTTLDENAIHNFIIGDLYFLTPSSLWRRTILEGKDLFDETLYNAHETDFNFRRLIEGCKFRYLEEILFYVRRGHQSIESESINNSNSIQSQFDYFQKVYFFLDTNNYILGDFKINQLKKYVIYRQIHFFYDLWPLLNFRNNLKNFRVILKDLLTTRINGVDFLRFFLGIVIVLFWGRGYDLIHIKAFDIRDKK
jgi:glycosyltransferase involved in cell wall biosynthesis